MEMSNCPYSNDYFAKCAEDFEDKTASPSFTMLPEIASCCGITVVGGSIPELNNGQLYNTCCVFGPDGKLKAKHRKVSKSKLIDMIFYFWHLNDVKGKLCISTIELWFSIVDTLV